MSCYYALISFFNNNLKKYWFFQILKATFILLLPSAQLYSVRTELTARLRTSVCYVNRHLRVGWVPPVLNLCKNKIVGISRYFVLIDLNSCLNDRARELIETKMRSTLLWLLLWRVVTVCSSCGIQSVMVSHSIE